MNLKELEDKVRALNVRQLEAALRFLNDGPLGYDYRKTGANKTFSKTDLQDRLINNYAPQYAARTGNSSIAKVWGDIEEALTNDQRVADVVSAGEGTIAAVFVNDPVHGPMLKMSNLGRDEGLGGQTDGGGQAGGGQTKQGKGKAAESGQEGSGEAGEGESDVDEGESEGSGSDSRPGNGAEKPGDGQSGGADAGEGGESGGEPSEKEGGSDGKDGESLEDKIKREVAQSLKEALDKNRGMKPKDFKALLKVVQEELDKRANVYRIEVKNPENSTEDKVSDEKPRHEIFKEFLEAVNAGENVLLVGPSGVGKTFMAREAAEIMGKSFGFTGAVSTEHKLLGYTDAHGRLVRTVYRDSYEKGWWFLWDELDASGAQAMLSFNAGLANGHQDFPDGIVPRHKDFRAIASANTYGHGADRQYVGRNQLDAASLDRFYVIPMDYDEKLERALYGNIEWVKYVQSARRAVRKLGLRHVVSMRAIESGLRMFKTGIPRADVERGALWKHLNKDDVARIKNEMFGRP